MRIGPVFQCRTITNPISIARPSGILEDAVQIRITLHLCHATRLFPDLFSSPPSHSPHWLAPPSNDRSGNSKPFRYFTIIRSLCHSLSRHSMEGPCNIFPNSHPHVPFYVDLSILVLVQKFLFFPPSSARLPDLVTLPTRMSTPENVQFSPDKSAILPTRS
jgi:hypothetical protein